MDSVNRVVVHFTDGNLLKGTTEDFFPGRPGFHLHTGSSVTDVKCAKLKAVFFVKDLSGNPQRRDTRGFPPGPDDQGKGKKIAVRFKDGELFCGYTLAFSRERDGFFVTPADPDSNNIRVYVMTAATTEVRVGPQAEAMAAKEPGAKAA